MCFRLTPSKLYSLEFGWADLVWVSAVSYEVDWENTGYGHVYVEWSLDFTEDKGNAADFSWTKNLISWVKLLFKNLFFLYWYMFKFVLISYYHTYLIYKYV